MHQSNTIFGLLMLLLSLASCGNRHTDGDKLPRVKDDALLTVLDSLSSQEFVSFYSKLSTRYEDTVRSISFKTSMRIVCDSAIGISVKYSAIPIISAVITADSLKLSNKREKCYILQSQRYFKETFGVDFSHGDLENIMMGYPVAFDKTAKYYRVKDPYAYWISSHKKKNAIRLDESDEKEVIFYYKLSDDLRNMEAVRIESPSDSTMVYVEYKIRQLVGDYLVPRIVSVTINTPNQELKLELEYKKARINNTEEIYFVIPESYDACN